MVRRFKARRVVHDAGHESPAPLAIQRRNVDTYPTRAARDLMPRRPSVLQARILNMERQSQWSMGPGILEDAL
jgi:hypothetical protein